MVSSHFRAVIRPVALAAALAAAGVSHAFSIDTTLVEAKGSYKLGSDAKVDLVDSKPTGNVDVLEFPNSLADSAGLHSYGSSTGNFGSRSSGSGIYDVTGSFVINQTITNTDSFAQSAKFNFYITPGWISTSMLGSTAADAFLSANISFDILVNGNSVWNSSKGILTNSSGTTISGSGVQSIYTNGGDGRSFSVGGQSLSVDLGVINAGSFINLTYRLNTAAAGNDLVVSNVIPGYTYEVPEQTIQYYDGQGYDANGYSCSQGGGDIPQARAAAFAAIVEIPGAPVGNANACGNLITEVIPAHTVEVPPEVEGFGGSSGAQSGDPFDIDPFTGQPIDLRQQNNLLANPFGISVTGAPVNAVPEPSTYALMLAGLGVLGWAARRRRTV